MNAPAKILSALRATSQGVSSADLCGQLGISRAAVWAHIEGLRKAGFEIVASPHRGYQLIRSPDALLADDLASQLIAAQVIGRKIVVLSETTSTNDEIEKAALVGHEEGLVVFAESQTQGRGRRGRSWSSPADAIEPETEGRQLALVLFRAKLGRHPQPIGKCRAKHDPMRLERLGGKLQYTVGETYLAIKLNPAFRQLGGSSESLREKRFAFPATGHRTG